MPAPKQTQVTPISEGLDSLFTVIYCFIDDTVKAAGGPPPRSGPKSRFSDSEALCVLVVGQLFGMPEAAWHRFLHANCKHLFPNLLESSVLHKRSKDLAQFLLRLREQAVARAGGKGPAHVYDSMPVPVCKRARAMRNRAWADATDGAPGLLFGYCAAKDERFYGFRLHLAIRPDGFAADFILAPASRHDVAVAPELAASAGSKLVVADKGYIGMEKRPEFGPSLPPPEVLTPRRGNQAERNSPWEDALLKQVRSGVETVNSLLARLGIASSGAKSMRGLAARVAAKVSCLTILFVLNVELGLNPCSLAGWL